MGMQPTSPSTSPPPARSRRTALQLAPALDALDAPATTPTTPTNKRRSLNIPDEPLIDIRTLAAWLSVSESVIQKWTAKGPEAGLAPRFLRINGQIRFRPADVREFLASREVR